MYPSLPTQATRKYKRNKARTETSRARRGTEAEVLQSRCCQKTNKSIYSYYKIETSSKQVIQMIPIDKKSRKYQYNWPTPEYTQRELYYKERNPTNPIG